MNIHIPSLVLRLASCADCVQNQAGTGTYIAERLTRRGILSELPTAGKQPAWKPMEGTSTVSTSRVLLQSLFFVVVAATNLLLCWVGATRAMIQALLAIRQYYCS